MNKARLAEKRHRGKLKTDLKKAIRVNNKMIKNKIKEIGKSE